jgi:hypothetical protein
MESKAMQWINAQPIHRRSAAEANILKTWLVL